MTIEINIKEKLKASVKETFPLIFLSTAFLVFIDLKDWAGLTIFWELSRAIGMAIVAACVAYTCLAIGLAVAVKTQSKSKGYFAGGASVAIAVGAVVFVISRFEQIIS